MEIIKSDRLIGDLPNLELRAKTSLFGGLIIRAFCSNDHKRCLAPGYREDVLIFGTRDRESAIVVTGVISSYANTCRECDRNV